MGESYSTSVGVRRWVVVSSPSAPSRLSPERSVERATVSAQQGVRPRITDAKVGEVLTTCGVPPRAEGRLFPPTHDVEWARECRPLKYRFARCEPMMSSIVHGLPINVNWAALKRRLLNRVPRKIRHARTDTRDEKPPATFLTRWS